MTLPKDRTTMTNTDSTAAAPADPELITLQQFFARFSITKSTWYRLANAGGAPPIVKIGRRTLVPLREAREWLAAQLRPAASLCQAAGAARARGSEA
jgi:predicted DNA-binding transcriptional regulator AlpA